MLAIEPLSTRPTTLENQMAHRNQAFDRTAARQKCYEFLGKVFGAKAGFLGFNKSFWVRVILDLKFAPWLILPMMTNEQLLVES